MRSAVVGTSLGAAEGCSEYGAARSMGVLGGVLGRKDDLRND